MKLSVVILDAMPFMKLFLENQAGHRWCVDFQNINAKPTVQSILEYLQNLPAILFFGINLFTPTRDPINTWYVPLSNHFYLILSLHFFSLSRDSRLWSSTSLSSSSLSSLLFSCSLLRPFASLAMPAMTIAAVLQEWSCMSHLQRSCNPYRQFPPHHNHRFLTHHYLITHRILLPYCHHHSTTPRWRKYVAWPITKQNVLPSLALL